MNGYVKGLTLTDKLLQNMQTLPEFLTQSYLNWQAEQGEIKTLEEYAEYLDVNRSLLSFWMNGKRVPNNDACEKISAKLGNDIYDILGKPRPNPYLQIVNRVFEHLPIEMQKRFSEEAGKYETENISDRVSKASKRRKARKPK